MLISESPCPANSIVYNKTLCACSPGFLLNLTSKSCDLFAVSPSEWAVNSGVDYSIPFPTTVFSFDRIKKFTQSQAVFLEATSVLLLSWLLFCALARFGKLGDGRTAWFRVRWRISRMDVCFATRHWLDDQKVVMKRKTELGGMFSIASWILFTGLFAAILYHILSRRSVEVHSLQATNAPDLASFTNALEFNITTISTMTCSQLHHPPTFHTANPSPLPITYKEPNLSSFTTYSCLNTSTGPKITLKCNNCRLNQGDFLISWHFIDIPNNPATAVGFEFNVTATNVANKRHVSFVSGKVKNGSTDVAEAVTFRGVKTNVLQFNLFPRIFHNFHGLKLVQPLFREFLPGSFVGDANRLRSSLESSSDGVVHTTLFIRFLSEYIVEVENQNIMGPVSFLANVGGLCCISFGIFYFLMVLCESMIKTLRTEDRVLRNLRGRRKAQDRWDKLRKYVNYTWGSSALQDDYLVAIEGASCDCCATNPLRKRRSVRERCEHEMSLHTMDFNKTDSTFKKVGISQGLSSASLESGVSSATTVLADVARPAKVEGAYRFDASRDGDVQPPPLSHDINGDSDNDVLDIQKSLRSLHEHSQMLRNMAARYKLDISTANLGDPT